MSSRDEARERERKRREDDREIKKIALYYRSLPADDQRRIDELSRHATELELQDRGKLQVDLQLVRLARSHKLPTPVSCTFARARHRRWLQLLREDHGPRIEEFWRERLARLDVDA